MYVACAKYDVMGEVTCALLSTSGKPLRSVRPFKSLRPSKYYWVLLETERRIS